MLNKMLHKAWDWILPVCLSALAALAPIKTVMITVGVLIFIDLFTGMYAAYKRGEKIKSSAMRRTISKMIAYQVAVVSGFIVEKFLMADALPASKFIAGAIGMVELKSILENANSIAGKNLFKDVVSKLGSTNDEQPR